MRRVPIPYPLLLAAYPVAAIYAENQAILTPADALRPVTVAVAAAGLLWIIAGMVLRDAQRGAAAATVGVLSLLAYDRVASFVNLDSIPLIPISLWAAGSLALAALAAWQWRWHRPLGVFALILFLLPVAKVVAFHSSVVGARVVEAATGTSPATGRPDVIYVVLDGYGRTDTFERLYGFSDREFVDGLKKRGFYVAEDSKANYCQTELSVAASLNMDYVQNLESIRPAPASVRPSFRDALESSVVVRKFESLGYRVSSIGTGFPPLSFYETELERADDGGLNLLESALLQKTPFRVTRGIWESQFDVRRRKILGAFERLGALGGRREKPRFTFAHILAPHPPFVFGANGEPLRPKGAFGFWDGSDYMGIVGNLETYRTGYAEQTKFVGREMLKAIDRVLSASGPKPIIILQGDHGPKMKLDQVSLERTDVAEVFPILSAFLVPEPVEKHLYPQITPVNTFRTIFREFFRDKLPNLPDRSWYSPYDSPLEFRDVTPQLSPKRA